MLMDINGIRKPSYNWGTCMVFIHMSTKDINSGLYLSDDYGGFIYDF